MNRKKLLNRITRGNISNVSFSDMVNLATSFGFQLGRVQGSHHIFKHSDIPELLNLQEVHGDAKPYQIRQFLRLVERYNLSMEADR
ncbi:MAG TPA: type II toxin-antitoxin system HicA family toxin [Thermoguttaceae bacterium]